MGTGDILLGICDGLAFRPDGSSNSPGQALCLGNQDKLRLFEPLARVHLYLSPWIPLIVSLSDGLRW